MAAVTNYRPA
jgi:hypothetical protein